MPFYRIFKITIRWFIGLLFITSSILKLFSLDTFVIYIHSFNLFNYDWAEILARCLIIAEFVIGCFILIRMQYKIAWWLATLMTIGFTLLLIYIVIFRNDANCHCFGDLIPIEPAHSIWKNIGILGLLLCIRKQPDQRLILSRHTPSTEDNSGTQKRWQWKSSSTDFRPKSILITFLITSLLGIIVCFVALTPNVIYNLVYGNSSAISIPTFKKAMNNDTAFSILLTDIQQIETTDTVIFKKDTSRLNLNQGRYVIAIMSSFCTFCRQSATLMTQIYQRHHIDTQKFIILIWGSDHQISRFIKATKTENCELRQVHPYLSIDITKGVFPTFAFTQNGEIVYTFDYRSINENEIVKFLNEGIIPTKE